MKLIINRKQKPQKVQKKVRRKEFESERFYYASQWQLIWRKFTMHKMAMVAVVGLSILYLMAIFAEFVAPYDGNKRFEEYLSAPISFIRIYDAEEGFRLPFIYGFKQERDPETLRLITILDKDQKYPVRFFTKGDPYKLWGFIESDIHLFNIEGDVPIFLFGSDTMGRDIFSRIVYGARISLSVGLVGVFISFILGILIGSISGYFGGIVDNIIQRIIEFLISIPTLPLWMALSGALPRDWSPVRIYFAITVLLSIVGWCSLARVVRGKLLALREEAFVMAARAAGATEWRIITKHLLPSFASYLIVSITLSIPGMILGETSLSFLGLGLQPPAISWGVLLQDAQNVVAVAHHPWQLIPVLFVIITVLLFNFLGDGLRDAADPYSG
ncbi:MAG: ABC transporter permease [Clostridia bacterium]|jgi:peptide/nickel transport system permease protein